MPYERTLRDSGIALLTFLSWLQILGRARHRERTSNLQSIAHAKRAE
jgi:hypothetical protein